MKPRINKSFSEGRTLELINKRILQFDGIMGCSDDIVGNFTDSAAAGIASAFAKARHKKEIEAEFKATLAKHEDKNTQIVADAESALFTTFTDDISRKVTVTPQYIKNKMDEINKKLWDLTKWFFTGKIGYSLDETTKTLHVGIQAQKVFTGSALRRRQYSMSDKTLTVTSAIAKNIIKEIFWKGISESGTVTVYGTHERCKIGFYRVTVLPKGRAWLGEDYYVFAGQTASDQALSDSECRELMALPVRQFSSSGDTYGDRDGLRKAPPNELDDLIDAGDFIRRAVSDTDESRREEIIAISEQARRAKLELNRSIESLKNELRQIENALSRTASITERVDAEKRKATASCDLKRQEQSLFMDVIKIDAQMEEAIQKLTDSANLETKVTRLFTIEITGGNGND